MLDLAVAVWILREKHPPCQPRFWLQLHLLCNSDWGAVCPVLCCRASVPDRASPKLSAEPASRSPTASSPERPWPPQGPGDGAPDPLNVSPQIPPSLPEPDATWAHPSCPSQPLAGAWLSGPLPGDISRGRRSSMPQPTTRLDSSVPSLQGPCDRSLKSEVPCGSCLNWR